jgi:hypothetical protein
MGDYSYILDNETLKPHDIVAIDVDIMRANDAMSDLAQHDIMAQIWAEPMMDFQSARRIEQYDMTTQQLTSRILRVWVSIRDHPKADRGENPTGIVTATLNSIKGAIAGAIAAWAGTMYTANAWVVERAQDAATGAVGVAGETLTNAITSPVGLSIGAIGVGLAVLWIIVNAKPQRS